MHKYSHNFHPYPAKFPAEAIREYVLKYTKSGDTILDPFCGSGTVLVESLLFGRNSIGIDLNPAAVLMSRAKARRYSSSDLAELQQVVDTIVKIRNVNQWIIENQNENSLIEYPNRDEWFDPLVLKELAAIKTGIINRVKNDKLKDLLLMAFSRIVVPVSKQDSETRYARVKKDLKLGDTITWFTRTLKTYHKELSTYKGSIKNNSIEVLEGDASEKMISLPSKSVDLVITSPPYINSFDYYLYHKHRIFLLGGDPLKTRKNEIGGHHTIDTQTFERALTSYTDQMVACFKQLNRVLKSRKRIVLLIGDGIVKGRVIDMVGVIENVAKQAGLKICTVNSVPLRAVSRRFIKDEKIGKKQHHVIILQKR